MMKRSLQLLTAIVALAAVVTVAVPEARAAVKAFFGWHSIKPAPPDAGSGQASFAREASGNMELSITTHSLEEARQFLGNGAALPPALEGAELFLYREVDKEGKVLVIGLSAPSAGFWARFRPAGDHKLEASYGSDLEVATEHRIIGGRPARLVSVTVKSARGKTIPELWLEDGNWVYEMRDDRGEMDRLIKMAELMR